MIMDSGISAGAIVVILLNLLLNREGGGHLAPGLGAAQETYDGPTGDSESTSVVLNNSERAAAWAARKAEDARTAVAEARAAAAKAEEIRAAEDTGDVGSTAEPPTRA
jgi:NCS2 family nucleobase:cation symporter-2